MKPLYAEKRQSLGQSCTPDRCIFSRPEPLRECLVDKVINWVNSLFILSFFPYRFYLELHDLWQNETRCVKHCVQNFFFNIYLHTEKSFRNLATWNLIWIVITLLLLIWLNGVVFIEILFHKKQYFNNIFFDIPFNQKSVVTSI